MFAVLPVCVCVCVCLCVCVRMCVCARAEIYRMQDFRCGRRFSVCVCVRARARVRACGDTPHAKSLEVVGGLVGGLKVR